MSTSEKYTARAFYTDVIAAGVSDKVTAFAKAEIEKLDARNAKRVEKLAEKHAEYEPVKDVLVNELLTAEPQTATDLGKHFEFSPQKMTPILKELVEEGKAIVTEIKVKGRKVNGYAKA